MSVYRRSSIPPPLRTEVSPSDLQHLDVLRRILALLDQPAASAKALAQLVEEMPVLAARLGASFMATAGTRPTTTQAELAVLGNRHLEAVLLGLLEDLMTLAAEQAGVPAHGSMFPPLATVRPPPPPLAAPPPPLSGPPPPPPSGRGSSSTR